MMVNSIHETIINHQPWHLILLKQRRPLHRRAMQPLTDAAIAEPGKKLGNPAIFPMKNGDSMGFQWKIPEENGGLRMFQMGKRWKNHGTKWLVK